MALSIAQKDMVAEGTSLHIVVTTLRCNQKCVYCQASSVNPNLKEYDMSLDTAKKTVDFIFQTPSNNITIEFQGGEPTMNFEVIKYINEYAKELNKSYNKWIEFLLVTNLNNMDEGKMNYLIDAGINICTSFDGHKSLHDKNRPKINKESSFDSAIYWVRKFNNEYEKRNIASKVYGLITITKESLEHPKKIIDEYVGAGFNEINIREMTSLGCATKQWKNIGYSPEEFIEFWENSMDYIFELNKKGVNIKERMICIMLRKMKGLEENFMDLRSPCGAVIGQMVYNHDGNIFSCDEGRMIGSDKFKVGSVYEDNYIDVVSSDKSQAIVLASLNDNIEPCNSCDYQAYCGICPVCNYAEQGEMVCDIKNTPRCKIFKSMFKYIDERYNDPVDNRILNNWVINHG